MSEELVAPILDLVNMWPGRRVASIAAELDLPYEDVYYALHRLQAENLLVRRDFRWFPFYEPVEGVLWGFEAEIDDRTCEKCRLLHGRTFIEEELTKDFLYVRKVAPYVWRPQVHPNCRCRLIRLVAIR
ncbi:MAG: hypothetical protein HWN68_02370 [Desulfobacterales bacterium]|nr:hypothetical protein [Desulfobacterales bacterium]